MWEASRVKARQPTAACRRQRSRNRNPRSDNVHVCSSAGCAVVHDGKGKCPACTARSRATQDRVRRPDGNPYTGRGHAKFRAAVLRKDPICTECGVSPSTVADHHPVERVDLIARGLDPNDAQYGRGVCKPCHDRKAGHMYGWAHSNTYR